MKLGEYLHSNYSSNVVVSTGQTVLFEGRGGMLYCMLKNYFLKLDVLPGEYVDTRTATHYISIKMGKM